MAATAAGAALTRQHRQTQAQVRALVLRRLLTLWPILDPARLDDTSPAFTAAAVDLVRGGHALSARAAASYYLAYRAAEGVGGVAAAVTPAVLDADAVRTSLIVTGPVALKRATGGGVPLAVSVPKALTQVSGAVARHVQSGAWDTVREAVQRDQQAQGWARVADANGCAFCLMLASRGPAYKSETTADFEAHDHCACGIEPAFDGYEWDPVAAKAAEAWSAATDRNGDWFQQWNDDYIARGGKAASDSAGRASKLINGPFRAYLAANPL